VKTFLFSVIFILFLNLTSAQDSGFGRISISDLKMTEYPEEPGAAAVVLREFGKSRIDYQYAVEFEYHVVIKILKSEGLKEADYSLSLYNQDAPAGWEDRLLEVKGTVYNLEPTGIVPRNLNEKSIFREKVSRSHHRIKFALPLTRVGSVIEIKFKTTSRSNFYFHPWIFQTHIPKIRSEYWTEIPGVVNYVTIMRGNLKLHSNTVERIPTCWQNTDCSLAKYVMLNVPAFKEEPLMPASHNYVSGIYFERSFTINPDGSQSWADVEKELNEHDYFGKKIKGAKKFMQKITPAIIGTESDPIKKAQLVFAHIRKNYNWTGSIQRFTETDISDSYAAKSGSSADINLALLTMLQAAGLDVAPAMLSTRENGMPPLYPQRTHFNYVVADIKLGEKHVLLDATDTLLRFGMLPMYCLNGSARVFGKDSTWVSLSPTFKKKSVVKIDIKIENLDSIKAKVNVDHIDYNAYLLRHQILIHADKPVERKILAEGVTVSKHDFTDVNVHDKPLKETLIASLSSQSASTSISYFNPFPIREFISNPFLAENRTYAIDFRAPIDFSYFISIEATSDYLFSDLPKSSVTPLPNNGGKCIFNVTHNGNKITITATLSLTRQIYEPSEYKSIRDVFDKWVSLQNTMITVSKKE
jgi:hypothetical protein